MFYSNSASKNALLWSWIKFLDTKIKEDNLLAMVDQGMQASELNTQAPTEKNISITSRSFILLFSFLFLFYLYHISLFYLYLLGESSRLL